MYVIIKHKRTFWCVLREKGERILNMDNNNMYGQGSQNTEQEQYTAYGQNYQQAYSQNPNQDLNQGYNQGYNQSYQQQYNQPYQQVYQPESELEEPVTFGDWMVTMLLMCVPCVNIIMMFVWAFGGGTKKSKSNYFKAIFVWILISIALAVILGLFIAAIMNTSFHYGM